MVRSPQSRGVSTESTKDRASASVMAGSATPSVRAMVCRPRGHLVLRVITDAATLRPVPVEPGVTTGVVPSRVTTASAVPTARVSSRELSAIVSSSASTEVTALTSMPRRRWMIVTGLMVGPTSWSTVASASTLTPESAGTRVSVRSPTVRVTG